MCDFACRSVPFGIAVSSAGDCEKRIDFSNLFVRRERRDACVSLSAPSRHALVARVRVVNSVQGLTNRERVG